MRMPWVQEQSSITANSNVYKVGVAGLATHITLWNSKTLVASLYLRLSTDVLGRECLGNRLNDPATRFLPCKVEDKIELLNLKMIAQIRILGPLPDVEIKEELGATRQAARVTLTSGYTLSGDFFSILPSSRSRLSDLLNMTDETFLLFLTPSAPMYLNREAIVRVVP
jgi:hypothetical protein